MVVYEIVNRINGKRYIGQTVVEPPERRFKRHCWNCTLTARRMPISKAILKYGKEAFYFKVLCRCSTQSELDFMERVYAMLLSTFSPNGYNLKAGRGRGACSSEVKAKIAASNTGRVVSAATRRRLSESHKGVLQTEAAKQKLSMHFKGKPGTAFCYKRSAEVSSKTYKLFSPVNEPVTVTNMARFCRHTGLSKFKMCEVVRGRRLAHKGWRADI